MAVEPRRFAVHHVRARSKRGGVRAAGALALARGHRRRLAVQHVAHAAAGLEAVRLRRPRCYLGWDDEVFGHDVLQVI